MTDTPESIYLIDGEWDGEHCKVWCESPAPSPAHEECEAVRYVRADRIAELEREVLTDTAQAGREAAEEERRKGFWAGFEIARMNPDAYDIRKHWNENFRLRNGGSESE